MAVCGTKKGSSMGTDSVIRQNYLRDVVCISFQMDKSLGGERAPDQGGLGGPVHQHLRPQKQRIVLDNLREWGYNRIHLQQAGSGEAD